MLIKALDSFGSKLQYFQAFDYASGQTLTILSSLDAKYKINLMRQKEKATCVTFNAGQSWSTQY